MTTTWARVLLATLGAACAVGACGSGSGHTDTSASSGGAKAPTTEGAAGRAAWTTYFHDSGRAGFASDGPVSAKGARRQWESPALDGDVYAEPLLAGERVIVATEHDTVYSLDATNGTIQWRTHVGEPVPASSLPCGNVDPVGITSTPVVDASAVRVYAVGMVQPAKHVLFELDLATGHVVASKPVDVVGADPTVHNQRSALTLSGGRVFIPFGGRFGDCGDYHGRVTSVRVSVSGLGASRSYTLPTQREGGFWAPPGAATARDGTLYLASGNSSSSTTYDYGNSVVRLGANLTLIHSWAPRNWKALNAIDGDIGSSGPVLVPRNRVFQIGKSGVGYLLSAGNLGGIGGELYSARVCGSGVWGATGHDGGALFVPCNDGVVQVTVRTDSFTLGWRASVATPGPTIVTPAAVWTVATATGQLIALDPKTGATLASLAIGSVPSRFTVPAAGGGRVVVAANRRVRAFAD
jgi:outer membrane protein assembly factor BamB